MSSMKMQMIRINYKGLLTDIPEKDVFAGVDMLAAKTPTARKITMHNVRVFLDSVLDQVDRDIDIPDKVLYSAQDNIRLWLANELLEGRANQYKIANEF